MNEMVLRGEILNIAAIKTRTRALGPGIRAALWFQGCPFHCAGCISPDWIEKKDAFLIKPDFLAEMIAKDPEISGITISGGEPFYQPLGLYKFIQEVNLIRPELTVIIFTGFLFEQLFLMAREKNINEILGLVDVLVDGPYIESENNNIGLRGSSNQRIHRLSNRFLDIDFELMPRINEISLENRSIRLSGIPDKRIAHMLSTTRTIKKEVHYVRT